MPEQLTEGMAKFGSKATGQDLIAYFQAYTNTYAPLPYLEEVYRSALDHPDVCGISIATRPDCLGIEVLDLLAKLRDEYPDKFLWIELGPPLPPLLQKIQPRVPRVPSRLGQDIRAFRAIL